MSYTIYLHRNMNNGKVYIGQTKQSLNHRWNKGRGYISCPYFYHSINKHGWENFQHIVLVTNIQTKERADQIEKEYITIYKSTDSKLGYNISHGGGGITGGIKYKHIYQYDMNGKYIRRYDSIYDIPYNLKSIRDCCRGIFNYVYGYQWRTFYKEKIEPAYNGHDKKVYQYDQEGIFIKEYNSITEASKINNYGVSGISKCCNGKQKSYKKYQWSFQYHDKIKPIKNECICQYTEDGHLLASYKTIKAAADATKTHASGISLCCSGTYQSAGSYIWKKYKSDETIVKELD